MFRVKRRTAWISAAACAGVLAVVVLVTGFSSAHGAGAGVVSVAGSSNAVYYEPGHRHAAPDFSGTTLTGARVRFASYRGKVVVLNFWGSWCVPCRTEAATLMAVATRYATAGVSFLGVDEQDNAASALAFTRSHGVTYPSVSDPDDLVTLDFGSAVPLTATPATLVIDATGHIAGAVFGETTYGELATLLDKVTGKR